MRDEKCTNHLVYAYQQYRANHNPQSNLLEEGLPVQNFGFFYFDKESSRIFNILFDVYLL